MLFRRTLTCTTVAAAACSLTACVTDTTDSADHWGPTTPVTEEVEPRAADMARPDQDELQWAATAASQCDRATAGLVAGLISVASNYDPEDDTSVSQGYTGMPEPLWQHFGAPVNQGGEPVGEAGRGDPNDLADASMAVGAQLCAALDSADHLIDTEQVSDNPVTVALAIIAVGEDRVEREGLPSSSCVSGGDCSALIRDYADTIDDA